MRSLIAVVGLASLLVPAAAAVRQDGDTWVLENDVLSARLSVPTGVLSVTDRATGAEFRQPDSVRDPLVCEPGREVVVRRASGPVRLDGIADEWQGVSLQALDGSFLSTEEAWTLDGPEDLQAAVGFQWDDQFVYALFIVGDDRFEPGSRAEAKWWQADSVEWWCGWDQTGVMLDPKDPCGFLWGQYQDWSPAGVRPVADLSADATVAELLRAQGTKPFAGPGYVVESATRVGSFITLQPVAEGRRFRLAAGVNDADTPGRREAQLYFPKSFRHSNTATYAVAVLADEAGRFEATPPPRPDAVTQVEPLGEDGLAYVIAADLPEATVGHVRCELRLPASSHEIEVSCAQVDGWEWSVPLFRGFLPVSGGIAGQGAQYVFSYYGDGMLISADDLAPPVSGLYSFANLDIPGVGVYGPDGNVLCLFRDYDLMGARLGPMQFGDTLKLGVVFNGDPSKKERLPAYRALFRFDREPGYIGMAKRVRSFCDEQGWTRTLREKRERNPNLDLLMGAPDVWGSNGIDFARQARAAGIRHLLVSGSYAPQAVADMVGLGYLCGEYDQYVDTDESTDPIDGVPAVPNVVRVNEDKSLATGWVVLDGSKTYYSRCSETALAGAKVKVPRVLADHAYNARFMDVHTAMGLVECWSDAHPCTKTEDRQNKIELLQWMRDQGLVLGGEHGRAWSAGVLDYQEGMMSGNSFFSWPAGHLVPIDKPEQISDAYLRYGIGPTARVPWFELAFHDCVVSTWYWGDSVDYHERVRPDITDRKVAFTALYGTVPLMWASSLGFGFEGDGKARFLQAYRNSCKIHEAVGYEPMVSHEFLTPDRTVQRTEFGDGTTVTVNLGDGPAKVESAGQTYELPPNGIVADGPTIHQHLALVDGRRQTSIERPGYRFLDGHGTRQRHGGLETDGPLTVEAIEPGHLRISVEPGTGYAAVDPSAVDETWDRRTARLIAVGPDLARGAELEVATDGERVVLGAPKEFATYDLLFANQTRAADVSVHDLRVREAVRQGEPAQLRVRITNRGGTAAQAKVTAYWDGVAVERVAGSADVRVGARDDRDTEIRLDTNRAEGPRRLIVVADTGQAELIQSDNRTTLDVAVQPDPARWSVQANGSLAMGDEPWPSGAVIADIDLSDRLGGGALDPASVRVGVPGDGAALTLLPSQFEPAANFDPTRHPSGRLLFSVPAELRQLNLHVCILAAKVGEGSFLPPAGDHFDRERGIVRRAGYEADLSSGAVRPLWRVDADGRRVEALSRVIFSSAETGWGEDEGQVKEIALLYDGPVCTAIRTVKQLPSDVIVTRTYEFYDDYFVQHTVTTEQRAGLFSRVWYSGPASYEDSNGHRVQIDGSGDAEGVGDGNAGITWYAAYGDRWSHACIALTPAAGQSYWDAGQAYGQLGFTFAGTEATCAHVIAGPEASADFARQWHDALASPPQLTLAR